MRQGCAPTDWKTLPLAQDGTVVLQTSAADRVFAGSPSVVALPGGRIVVAVDQFGAGVRDLPGTKGKLTQYNRLLRGSIFSSNDKGQTWTHRADFPFCNPCLFRDGATLYLIGHDDNLQIIKSPDGGESWSKPVALTRDGAYGDTSVQSPAGVLAAHGYVYAVAMRVTQDGPGSLHSRLAPVLMRAAENSGLASAKAWSFFSPEKTLAALLAAGGMPEGFGVPLFPTMEKSRGIEVSRGRWANPVGWSAAHAVQVRDPAHLWYDSRSHAVHLIFRADMHRSNMGVLMKASEDASGAVSFAFERTPSGRSWTLLPLPGGQAKFDILFDEPSGLYWLASNQSTDSMTRPERLPEARSGLPCDETHRLQLHYSRNLVDWSYAGLITAGGLPQEHRHSCSLSVRGSDLCAVCCVGDAASRTTADTTRVTFHLIPDFRDLAC
jgi:hypothetical protein